MRTGELYQRYYGHYMAKVVDVNDPQKLGRVRLQADQFADTIDQPIWASVSRPAAGDKTGVFFTPKKGDQVVISFVSGDVREPVIAGYAHSTQSAPDPNLVGPQKHAIVTDAGSVAFDDENGTITITLNGPLKQTVTLDKKNGVKIDFAGPPESTITMDPVNGIMLAYGGPTPINSITLGPAGIAVVGLPGTFTFNGAPVA